MAKDVLQKLDDMYGKANDSEKAIIDFLKVWIAEDESAAEKVGADKKTPGGAYNAMRDFAKGKRIQCLHGKEAWVQVMKYYGEDETSADQKLEHGLMFACMRAAQSRPCRRTGIGPPLCVRDAPANNSPTPATSGSVSTSRADTPYPPAEP